MVATSPTPSIVPTGEPPPPAEVVDTAGSVVGVGDPRVSGGTVAGGDGVGSSVGDADASLVSPSEAAAAVAAGVAPIGLGASACVGVARAGRGVGRTVGLGVGASVGRGVAA